MIVDTLSCRKFVLWHSLYRLNIFTHTFHCQLMLEFGDCVLRLHYVWRGWREFKSCLGSIMMFAHFISADQEHVNTAQGVEMTLENQHDIVLVLSIAVEWFVKTLPNIVHVQLGYSQVCDGGYQDAWRKFTKIDVWRCSFTSSVI